MASDRMERLRDAVLYLVCDAHPGGREAAPFLDAALRGGVDVVQLRDKRLDHDGLVAAAVVFRAACAHHDALFVLNDDPELAAEVGADGVHVGQDDAPADQARAAVGPERIVGLSTHTAAQFDAAVSGGVADYVAVGPVHATPTKPGRPAAGLEPVRHAARHASLPWFAIGGLDEARLAPVVAAGARRAVVVRALTLAPDPERAARALRRALGARPA